MQKACEWFDRANLYGSTLLWVQAARRWCAEPDKPLSPPLSAAACRRVVNAEGGLDFRTKPLTQAQYNAEISWEFPNKSFLLDPEVVKKQAKGTFIGYIPLGATVILLDSTRSAWKVEYDAKTGYIARSYRGYPTLFICKGNKEYIPGKPIDSLPFFFENKDDSDSRLDSTTLPASPDIPLPDLLPIPAGSFMRGCADEKDPDCGEDEKPAKEVKIKAFWMGRTEVTNEQYCAFLNEKGNREEGGADWIDLEGKYEDERCRIHEEGGRFKVESGFEKYPVIFVSWYGSKAYCDWLNEKVSGRNYRLPTEAEWEYAAGNGSRHTKYSWGNQPPAGKKGGNVADESAKKRYEDWKIFEGYTDGYVYTAPVTAFEANDFGLYDMSGNVWEWCSDWYDSNYYETGPTDNPQGPGTGSDRVYRGGSWNNVPRSCRVTYRFNWQPVYRYYSLGFRVASSSQ